jgi:ankyrin repeat protein/tetratricopeptide (TPR) repeat protein
MRNVLAAVLAFGILAGCEKLSFDSKPAASPTKVASVPEYSADSDPARAEFEKANDLIQSINWTDDQPEKSRQFVEQLKQTYPDSPYPLLAEAALELQDWRMQKSTPKSDRIRALVQQSFRKSRAIADAYVILAKLDLEQGLTDTAGNSGKAFKLAPDKPEVRYVMARVAQQKKSYDEAEQHYRKYLEVSQKPIRQSNIYYTMAGMFTDMRPPQLDKADEAYQLAMKLDPLAPWKMKGYAQYLLLQRGDYEGALFYLEQATKIMQHSEFERLAVFAVYAKWADGYANKGARYKARSDQSVVPQKITVADLQKISAAADVSADTVFVELAAGPASGYAAQAMLKAKLVKNIDVKTTGECGCTALTKAGDANNLELAKFLVANKANVNGTNASGETALTRFILQKNWEAVTYLLDHGARVNFVDNDGMTPLQVVHVYADADITGLRLLLERKADPSVPLQNGYTLLYSAVTSRDAERVALLLKHGADPNQVLQVKRSDGEVSVLWDAVQFGYQDMVDILLKNGADPWVVDDWKFNLLETRQPAIFKMLSDARQTRPRTRVSGAAPPGIPPAALARPAGK